MAASSRHLHPGPETPLTLAMCAGGVPTGELSGGACTVRPLRGGLGDDELMGLLVGHPEHFADVADGYTLAGQVMG